MFKKYKNLALVIVATIAISAGGVAEVAHANPSVFPAIVTLNQAATTSPVYMTAGTATSTMQVDSFTPSKPGLPSFKLNSIGLAIQYQGSSTASVLNTTIEMSQDGVDWYTDTIIDSDNYSTTTAPIYLGLTNTLTMPFASSTQGGIGITSANSKIMTRFVNIDTPARYVRAVFSETGTNGAVWASFIPVKEQY